MKICSIEGCVNIHLSRGYCRKHYLRWYKNGDPNITKIDRDLSTIERIISKCIRDKNGCLIYTGKLSKKGYVFVRDNITGKMKFGHVLVYEYYKGKIPEGLEIDHTCFQ